MSGRERTTARRGRGRSRRRAGGRRRRRRGAGGASGEAEVTASGRRGGGASGTRRRLTSGARAGGGASPATETATAMATATAAWLPAAVRVLASLGFGLLGLLFLARLSSLFFSFLFPTAAFVCLILSLASLRVHLSPPLSISLYPSFHTLTLSPPIPISSLSLLVTCTNHYGYSSTFAALALFLSPPGGR